MTLPDYTLTPIEYLVTVGTVRVGLVELDDGHWDGLWAEGPEGPEQAAEALIREWLVGKTPRVAWDTHLVRTPLDNGGWEPGNGWRSTDLRWVIRPSLDPDSWLLIDLYPPEPPGWPTQWGTFSSVQAAKDQVQEDETARWLETL